ncbi:MAG: hypothetical protein ACPG7U_01010 [Holosporaceae bacterium]
MSSSADGAQANPKVDSDKAPAAGKGAVASGGVKPPSSHATSHSTGGGSGTPHTSSGQGSHHSTPTAPDMPQASGTTASDAPPSTAAPKSNSTSTSTGMQVDKETQAPEIKVEPGDRTITPTKYKDPSASTDFTS